MTACDFRALNGATIMLTNRILSFTNVGAEWVLWLLLILSIVSVSIMIERARYFASRRIDVEALARDVRKAVRQGDLDATVKKWSRDRKSVV